MVIAPRTKVKRFVVVASGFRQGLGFPSGVEDLWFAASALDTEEHKTLYVPWKADAKATAEFIIRNIDLAQGDVIFAGYSWGCGYFGARLFKYLKRGGVRVSCAIFCDGVWRHPLVPAWIWFNPIAYLSVLRISIPSNVERVCWFYQRQRRPWANRPKAQNPFSTVVEDPIKLKTDHVHADESVEWHKKVMDILHGDNKPQPTVEI